jgi:hypothetical protein
MPIQKTVLEEPLLSRKQAAVLRDIARAASLTVGLIEVEKVIDSIHPDEHHSSRGRRYRDLKDYLRSEAERVLMQIKTPAKPVSGEQSSPDSELYSQKLS